MIELRLTLPLCAALLVAGCQGDAAEPPAGTGACDPAAAESLVGQPRVTDDRAMELTGATVVRQIGPGDPVTMDFNEARVTIETDPASGNIVRASCG